MTDGVTEDGGGAGFYRQDAYGYYTQIRHQHGFTSGPAATKSSSKKSSDEIGVNIVF